MLERREIVRVECKVPAVCLFPDGKQSKAVVVDMGMKGLRLECRKKLPANKTVRIMRPDGGPVNCKIVWCKPKRFSDRYLAGLEFSDTPENLRHSWIKNTLQNLGFVPGRIKEKRMHIRVPAEQRASLVSAAGDELTEGLLINLGIGGALVEMGVLVPKALRVSLRVDPMGALPALELPCEIRSAFQNQRNQKFMHGLRFDDQDNDLVKKYLALLMKSV